MIKRLLQNIVSPPHLQGSATNTVSKTDQLRRMTMSNQAKLIAKAASQRNRAQLQAQKSQVEAKQHRIKHLSKRPQPRTA